MHDHQDHETAPVLDPAQQQTSDGAATRPTPIVAGLLDLQRAAGNQAVGAAIAQRQALTAGVSEATAGSGSSIPAPLRVALESHVGADLSGVRVHSGGSASRSAADLGAEAYTVGENIVLGQGSGDLHSPAGRHRLAHEVTHVVQQRSGPVSGTAIESGLAVSSPADSFEQAAEASASAFTRNAAEQH